MESKIKLGCIIDDDNTYIKLISKLIEVKKLCQNLLVFKNGEEAFNYFNGLSVSDAHNESIPELIFLDLNMPIMNGWQFLEKFKGLDVKLKNSFKLYIMSSSINPVDKQRAKEYDLVSGFISKPIQTKKLEEVFGGQI